MSSITLPYNWTPRTYQVPLWRYMEGEAEGKRAVAVWHRRAGKDLMAINLIATKAMERTGTYWHLLPTYKQGRNIVWNGFTRDGRKFLDHFPKEIVESIHNNEMRVHFKNGSIYQVVGTDEVDSLVGTNPIGCVFSEYSLHDPAAWDYIRPILAENGGWSLFIYTPRGHNWGWNLLNDAREAGWFVDLRKAGSGPDCTKRHDGTPVVSDEIIANERKAGMSDEMIAQEFFVSFDAPLVGAYYAKEMEKAREEGRITNVPYDPKLPVDTAWDIGVGDSTSIVFTQSYGFELRIIDYFEASGEGLPFYARILQERGYVYGKHYAPHDIEVREYSSGKTRLDTARKLGIKFEVTPKHSVMDGIDQVRNTLPSCYFDQKRCARLIDALSSYRKEPLPDKMQFATRDKMVYYKDEPLHDWSSHGADCVRYRCWNLKRGKYKDKTPQARAVDEFNYV